MSADFLSASAGVRAAGRGAGRTAVLAAAMLAASGCYVYTPVRTAPEPGMRVALDLNDRGRLALGDSVGSSADRIEGVVQSGNDSLYVLRVKSVRYLNGETNNWTDEPLTVRAEHVRNASERRFSRQRTFLVSATATAALVTFVVSRDLFGISPPGPSPTDGGPGPDQ